MTQDSLYARLGTSLAVMGVSWHRNTRRNILLDIQFSEQVTHGGYLHYLHYLHLSIFHHTLIISIIQGHGQEEWWWWWGYSLNVIFISI